MKFCKLSFISELNLGEREAKSACLNKVRELKKVCLQTSPALVSD